MSQPVNKCHQVRVFLLNGHNLSDQLTIEEEGKKPGPQGLAALIDQAQAYNITVVYVEPQFDRSSAEVIAESIGGEVVEIDPLAPNYIENIRDVADKIEGGFDS